MIFIIINQKITKVNIEIDKVKSQISVLQAKVKDLEKQKTKLEDEAIVALFRNEKTNEDGYKAIMNAKFSPKEFIKNREVVPNGNNE